MSDADWWRQGVVYQIYPRSFADSNADGIGDLAGIASRIDYLACLNIDAVWLSPFYPSELADGGYDVIDYRDVDPRIGTLAQFRDLVTALHERGIRVVIDIVPNHTSNKHPWFVAAVNSEPGSRERARYHFFDGSDGNQPPSDWQSAFGGSAWTQVPDGQWYLHTFAVEQPDLNWDNPEVRQDFLDTLRFWADLGVDGFRVDAAHFLAKDMSLPLPSKAELEARPRDGHHPLADRDELRDIYAKWREVFNSYDPPRTAVAEADVPPSRVPLYASPDTLGQAFFFDLQHSDYSADRFKTIIDECLEVARTSGSSVTWVLNNHDTVRHASRYGTAYPGLDANGQPVRKHGGDWLLSGGDPVLIDAAKGLRRARAATLLLLALPGAVYLYQGEELGLQEVAEISDKDRQDPTFFRHRGVDIGRDGCRVPLPWTRSGPSYGFGTAGSHLPQPLWFSGYSVQTEEQTPGSTLRLYRQALKLRRELLTHESLTWEETGSPDVLAFSRPNGWRVLSNFGVNPIGIPDGQILLSSGEVSDVLPAETTIWYR